jgi:hypothetical protein
MGDRKGETGGWEKVKDFQLTKKPMLGENCGCVFAREDRKYVFMANAIFAHSRAPAGSKYNIEITFTHAFDGATLASPLMWSIVGGFVGWVLGLLCGWLLHRGTESRKQTADKRKSDEL